MNKSKLKGGVYSLISAFIGLSIAKLLIGNGSMGDSAYFAVISFLFTSFLFGLKAGELIIDKVKNYGLIGILTAFFSVWTATLLGVTFDIIITKSFLDLFSFRYLEEIIVGILLFTFYGGIPILIIGFLYGLVLKLYRKRKK